jgi:hypothetical protein
MIIGAHFVLSSTNAEADRAFLRDALHLPHVEAGAGWLIFGLPHSEVAVHPADANGRHEFFLMCHDVRALIARMRERDVACSGIYEQPWGKLVQITVPGGGKIGVYEPLHPRPDPMRL